MLVLRHFNAIAGLCHLSNFEKWVFLGRVSLFLMRKPSSSLYMAEGLQPRHLPVFRHIAEPSDTQARIHRRYGVTAAEWAMRGKGRRWSGHDFG